MIKKRLLSICMLFILLLSFSACKSDVQNNNSNDTVISSSATILGKGEKNFIFTVADADGNEEMFNIFTDKKTVGDALKEHKLIDGEEGQFGLYVKTVNSISYDYDKDGKYWAFYVDGEYASTGVDKTEIKNGCSYMFKAE
ncbi:MAG: DUF4430 domain-containing protein [Clostridia bacterium]|nr:DUF4430 domain-containing protein [Clostridia bacterium]